MTIWDEKPKPFALGIGEGKIYSVQEMDFWLSKLQKKYNEILVRRDALELINCGLRAENDDLSHTASIVELNKKLEAVKDIIICEGKIHDDETPLVLYQILKVLEGKD